MVSTLTRLRDRLFGPGENPRDIVFRHAPKGGSYAEVGVWKGDFSERILRKAAPARLYLVDPWAYVSKPPHNQGLYGDRQGQAGMDRVAEGVRRRFERELRSGCVQILRQPSLEAARELPDGALDWVYIDGDHTFEAVLDDLRGWWPKVRAHGVLCGDDYGVDDRWWGDGVTAAVDAFIGQTGCRSLIQAGQFILFR